tara:strand:+ start:86747 stop:87073 length:327 start_codon:yes stop_codon:yes gene_type:complete
MEVSDPDHLIDTYVDEERAKDIKQIEIDTKHLMEIQLDVASLVSKQSEKLNEIEEDFEIISEYQEVSNANLASCEKRADRWRWFVAGASGIAATLAVAATSIAIIQRK